MARAWYEPYEMMYINLNDEENYSDDEKSVE